MTIIKKAIVLGMLVPLVALAQPLDLPATDWDGDRLIDSIETVAGWVFTIAMILSIFIALYAAFIYLTSEGDTEKTTQARRMLLYAAVGVAVAIIAGSFPAIIASFVDDSVDASPF